MDERLSSAGDVGLLEAKLRSLPRASAAVVRLSLSGALPLSVRADLDARLEQLAAALFWLETDWDGLAALPTPEEFDHIDFQGVLREAATILQALASNPAASEPERRRADAALVELFLLTRANAGEPQP